MSNFYSMSELEASQDLLGNGKVVKTIETSGDGEYATPGSKVNVHYTGRLEDGTKFDSSRDRGTPFSFTLGAGEVIRGWDVAVASMKKGEKCSVKIASDFAYGASGAPPTIPPNATLVFDIELLSFEVEKKPYAMSADEKLTAAEESKLRGTSLLQSGKYSAAIKAYEEATSLLDPGSMDSFEANWPDKAQCEKAQALYVSSLLNVALTQMKLENWLETKLATTNVLRFDSKNIKALYRRALARTELGEYELAILDLQNALEHDPENKDVARQLTITKTKKLNSEKKTKDMYKRMF